MKALRELLAEISGEPTEKREIEEHEKLAEDYQSAELNEGQHMFLPPAIETLVATFGLSSFERKVILLCAGMELDAHFHREVLRVAGHLPTFSLALSTFSDAHWSALSPANPLRYWGLIEVQDGQVTTQSTIHIDERILHFLTGVAVIDEHITELTTPVYSGQELPFSHSNKVKQVLQFFKPKLKEYPLPIICLTGPDRYSKTEIAAQAARELGFKLYRIMASAIPATQKEISRFARRWSRETALTSTALLLDCGEVDRSDKNKTANINAFVETVQGLLMISAEDWTADTYKTKLEIQVGKPTTAEQHELWKRLFSFAPTIHSEFLQQIVSQFDLNTRTIQTISKEVSSKAGELADDDLEKEIWETCCRMTRPKLSELAQPIEVKAGLQDIVLPPHQLQLLQDIIQQVRYRGKVYQEWGFAAKSNRGLGISALFVGESGTGKTMASEVLAHELGLDLYRIDLSQTVSKYIGETEKNLKQIFDAAEDSGAILLFDEADALFGQRSEVKDSHDRFGNQQVSYLLQRMEAYRGLAVMTSNMRKAIDTAFLRRIRFIIQFPYPDLQQRTRIWQNIFPLDTPLGDVDVNKLARLNIAGGNIRNIAVGAAFFAAHENQPVQMRHIAMAAKNEYAKLEKPLSSSEVKGW